MSAEEAELKRAERNVNGTLVIKHENTGASTSNTNENQASTSGMSCSVADSSESGCFSGEASSLNHSSTPSSPAETSESERSSTTSLTVDSGLTTSPETVRQSDSHYQEQNVASTVAQADLHTVVEATSSSDVTGLNDRETVSFKGFRDGLNTEDTKPMESEGIASSSNSPLVSQQMVWNGNSFSEVKQEQTHREIEEHRESSESPHDSSESSDHHHPEQHHEVPGNSAASSSTSPPTAMEGINYIWNRINITDQPSIKSVEDLMGKCRVCEEPSAGFHFGAYTCEGCKSFFCRNHRKQNLAGICARGGNCSVIGTSNRSICKACRMKKCIQVGMNPANSRFGRRPAWMKNGGTSPQAAGKSPAHSAIDSQSAAYKLKLERSLNAAKRWKSMSLNPSLVNHLTGERNRDDLAENSVDPTMSENSSMNWSQPASNGLHNLPHSFMKRPMWDERYGRHQISGSAVYMKPSSGGEAPPPSPDLSGRSTDPDTAMLETRGPLDPSSVLPIWSQVSMSDVENPQLQSTTVTGIQQLQRLAAAHRLMVLGNLSPNPRTSNILPQHSDWPDSSCAYTAPSEETHYRSQPSSPHSHSSTIQCIEQQQPEYLEPPNWGRENPGWNADFNPRSPTPDIPWPPSDSQPLDLSAGSMVVNDFDDQPMDLTHQVTSNRTCNREATGAWDLSLRR